MTMGKELNLPVPASNVTRLPLFLDICLNVSQIFILLVTIAAAVLSIQAKADILTVIFRTAITLLAVGIPVFIFNYLVGRYFIQATLAALVDSQQAKEEPENNSGEFESQA